jgi:hypothetical protein
VERLLDPPVENLGGDEVQEQRREDLVDAALRPQDRCNPGPSGAAHHPRDNRERQMDRDRQRSYLQRHDRAEDPPDHDLAGEPNLNSARSERDDPPQRDQAQGDHLGDRSGQVKLVAERSLVERGDRPAGRDPVSGNEDQRDRQGDDHD